MLSKGNLSRILRVGAVWPDLADHLAMLFWSGKGSPTGGCDGGYHPAEAPGGGAWPHSRLGKTVEALEVTG